MKLLPILLLGSLVSGCTSRTTAPMVRTTITRPVTYEGVSSRGVSLTTSSMETITTEQPYQSPAYQAAGAALFSR